MFIWYDATYSETITLCKVSGPRTVVFKLMWHKGTTNSDVIFKRVECDMNDAEGF